jgi:hypothetical protein
MLEELLQKINDLETRLANQEIQELGITQGTWTPTITQSGAVTGTVNTASYRIIDKLCTVHIRISVTGSGTIGNGIVIGGQPTAIQPTAETLLGTFLLLDAGTAYYVGAVRAVTATNWQMFSHNQGSSVGANPSFALASGDAIYMVLNYELP